MKIERDIFGRSGRRRDRDLPRCIECRNSIYDACWRILDALPRLDAQYRATHYHLDCYLPRPGDRALPSEGER